MRPLLRLAAGLLALVPALHGAGAVRQVTLAPAPVERAAQVVTLTLPQTFAAGAILRDEHGEVVPLQAEADLTARFIVARQAANQTLKFTLEPGRLPEQGNVQVLEEPSPPRPGNTPGIATATAPSRIQTKTGRLRVSVGGRPILYYQMDRDAVPREDIEPALRRAGYLHPVLTPRGFTVTEAYATEKFTYTQPGIAPFGPLVRRDILKLVTSEYTGDRTVAPIEFGGIDSTWAGPVHGGFMSWHCWVEGKEPETDVLMNESWELTAYALPRTLSLLNIFDLAITQTNTSGRLLTFPAGLGVPVPAQWDQAGADTWFSDYKTSPVRNRWMGLQGKGENDPAGIAVLFPLSGSTGFGSNTSRIFATEVDPTAASLAPGGQINLRYRLVVFDGPPDKALLEALWNGYTVPAVVVIAPADGR